MKIIRIVILGLLAISMYSCKNETKHLHQEHDQKIDRLHLENSSQEVTKSTAELKAELTEKGYQIFDYVDAQSGDTILMQEYYMAFLKRGSNRSQTKTEAESLQKLHLAHLGRMYESGFADISGPFGDDGDIRGITIYNVPSLKMADSLANLDPMVKSGRLVIEMHPWWAAKGFPLR